MTPEQLLEIEYKLDNLTTTNKEILNLLKGNVLDKSDAGLLGKVADNKSRISELEKRIEALEKLKDKFIYLALGAGAALGWSITDLIGKIFTKH